MPEAALRAPTCGESYVRVETPTCGGHLSQAATQIELSEKDGIGARTLVRRGVRAGSGLGLFRDVMRFGFRPVAQPPYSPEGRSCGINPALLNSTEVGPG